MTGDDTESGNCAQHAPTEVGGGGGGGGVGGLSCGSCTSIARGHMPTAGRLGTQLLLKDFYLWDISRRKWWHYMVWRSFIIIEYNAYTTCLTDICGSDDLPRFRSVIDIHRYMRSVTRYM
jgi:hypothetical protein